MTRLAAVLFALLVPTACGGLAEEQEPSLPRNGMMPGASPAATVSGPAGAGAKCGGVNNTQCAGGLACQMVSPPPADRIGTCVDPTPARAGDSDASGSVFHK